MFLNELVEQQLGPGPFQPNSHIRCAFPLREDPDIAGRRFLVTYEDLEPGLIFKPAICHVILKRGYDWVASSWEKLIQYRRIPRQPSLSRRMVESPSFLQHGRVRRLSIHPRP